MKRKLVAAAVVILGAVTFAGSGPSWAAKTDLPMAIANAETALAHAKVELEGCVHLPAALKHAEAAQQEVANPHLSEAIKRLKAGIAHRQFGHANAAIMAIESAVEHLKAVEQ